MRLVVCFLLLSIKGMALSYPEVEMRSKIYFEQENWRDLIALGDSAEQSGIHYFGLSYRLMVGHFALGSFLSSENHGLQALNFDPTNQYVLQYMVWIAEWQEKWGAAAHYYDQLTDEFKNQTKRYDFKGLEHVAVGVGYKKSSNSEMIPRQINGNVFAGGFFSPKWKWNAGVGSLNFNNSWSTNKQNSFYFSSAYYLGGQWQLKFYGTRLGYNGTFDQLLSESPVVTAQDEYKNVFLGVGAKLEYRKNNWLIDGAVHEQYNSLSSTVYEYNQGELPPVFSKDSSSQTVNYQVDLGLTWQPIRFEKLALGARFYLSDYHDGGWATKGFVSYTLPQNRWYGSYFYGVVGNVIQNDGRIILNTLWPLQQRATIGLQHQFNKKVMGTFEWSGEYYENNFSYQSFYAGLNFRL